MPGPHCRRRVIPVSYHRVVACLLPVCLAACAPTSGAPITTAASCADAIAATRVQRRVVDLDVRIANAPVDLAIGDVLRIRLPASPATGHAWTLDANVPAFLCVESDPGNRAVNADSALDTWTFRAHGAGRGTLQFSFGRHGVPGPEGPRTALFDIRVPRTDPRPVAPAR